jgi:hypothetical protein
VGASQAKAFHKKIDQLYTEYTKVVIHGAAPTGRIKDRVCYIDSSGKGIILTHDQGENFNITTIEELYCAYVRVNNLEAQNNGLAREDLIALYSDDFLRGEMMSITVNSFKEKGQQPMLSSLTNSRAILVKDFKALSPNTRKNLQRIITLKIEPC